MIRLEIQSNFEDAEHLIRSAISSQIKRLRLGINKAESALKQFEDKYHISSEDFLSHGSAEDLEGEDEEYVAWLGEFKIKQALTEELNKLSQAEYVTQPISA